MADKHYPVILYVPGETRATFLQCEHDPEVLTVLPIMNMGAYRASSIIVEMPRYLEHYCPELEAIHEWLDWLPTRLMPGVGRRITVI